MAFVLGTSQKASAERGGGGIAMAGHTDEQVMSPAENLWATSPFLSLEWGMCS